MTQPDESPSTRTSEEDALLAHLLMGAFIEIRASEDLGRAQSIAHVFHNIPMMMHHNASLDELKRELKTQSEWKNISGLIHSWFLHAQKRVKPE